MRTTHLLLATVVSIGLLATFSCSGPEKIIVGMDASFPPMEVLDASKDIIGADADMIRAVAKEGGFQVQLANEAWDTIFEKLESGRIDLIVSSLTITDERKTKYEVSDPYMNGDVVVVVGVNTNADTLAQLKHETVAIDVLPPSIGAETVLANNEITVKKYGSVFDAIPDVTQGAIAGFLMDRPIARHLCNGDAAYKGKLRMVAEPVWKAGYGILARKGNVELIARINKALKKVLASGEIERIESKWFRDSP